MPSQRPFFLSTLFTAFRQQSPSPLSTTTQQANKHTTQAGSTPTYNTPGAGAATGPRSISSSSPGAAQQQTGVPASAATTSTTQRSGGIASQLPLHSPRAHGAMPIPTNSNSNSNSNNNNNNNNNNSSSSTSSGTDGSYSGRRRGSDSSSEGFRDVLGADKWYIGGRTAAGEEKFFKLGVVRRVRSGDRLSLDRLSL